MSNTFSFSCGVNHTICISCDGSIFYFGKQEESVITIPKKLDFSLPIKNVSCGHSFSVLLDWNGNLWSFGDNSEHQLGLSIDTKFIFSPIQIEGADNVESVNCGANHTLFLKENNQLWGFGDNSNFQIGIEDSSAHIKLPQLVPNVTNVKKINCGGFHTIIQTFNKEIIGFGNDSFGCLGYKYREERVLPTVLSDFPSSVVSIGCGYIHSVFLLEDGTVYSCGFNDMGQCGHSKQELTKIEGAKDIISIHVGFSQTILIDKKHNIWGLGYLISKSTSICSKIKFKNIKQIYNIKFGDGFCIISNHKNELFALSKDNELVGQISDECNRKPTKYPQEFIDNLLKPPNSCKKSARKVMNK